MRNQLFNYFNRLGLAATGAFTGFLLANLLYIPPSISRIHYIEELQGLPSEIYLQAKFRTTETSLPKFLQVFQLKQSSSSTLIFWLLLLVLIVFLLVVVLVARFFMKNKNKNKFCF